MEQKTPNFLDQENSQAKTQDLAKKPQKLFFMVGFLFLIILGATITFTIIHFVNNKNTQNYDIGQLEAKKPKGILGKLKDFIFSGAETLDGSDQDRINILILGEGGPGHDGPYLTDTIILASIKPSTNQIAMVSIPRDLNVIIGEHGKRKINNANAFAEAKEPGTGPAAAIDVVEKTFDTHINYYIRVDFAAFEELIDKVGGLDISVDQSFTDAEYPIPGNEDVYPISDRYKILQFKAGNQHMDGRTALEYARSRHGNNGEGSDYARSRRQQKVLVALKEKILSAQTFLNPVKISDLITTVQSHILTNIGISQILQFANLASTLDTQNIHTVTLDDSPSGYLYSGYDAAGAFVLEPKTGNFIDINNAIANIFNSTTSPKISSHPVKNQLASSSPLQASDQRTSTLSNTEDTSSKNIIQTEAITIEIHNGTWAPGLAAKMKSRLLAKSFKIGTIGNSVQRPQTKSGIYILNEKENRDTLKLLQDELKIPLGTKIPEGETYSEKSDILILLGEDFTQ